MKITVEYKDDAEKQNFLSVVAHTINPPIDDLAKVEDIFRQHLVLLAQRTYIDGASRKVNLEKAEDFKAQAAGFFKE